MTPSQIAKALGRRGGQARARRLSAAERRRIAALGGSARRESLLVARRIADNFAYVAASDVLRGTPATISRTRRHVDRLPGIYPP